MPVKRVSTSVSLDPELNAWVIGKVKSDPTYSSASEVVREGLRLLRQRELAEQGEQNDTNKTLEASR